MNPSDQNRDPLSSIEHELYDPKAKMEEGRIHHTRPQKVVDLPTSWGNDSPIIVKGEVDRRSSFGTKFFLFATILLLIALSFSAWRVFSLRNVVSATNIDMTAEITPFVQGGESTPLILTLRNRNVSPLESASVTLLYKQGNGSQDEQEKVQEKRDLGTVNSGEYKKQDFTLSLYGSESETRVITLKLEYKVAGSNATFSKLVTTSVVLRTPPISVSINGPETLSVGQSGSYSFVVINNSSTSSLPSVLQLTLPNSLSVDTTVPPSSTKNNSWAIPSLPSGGKQTVTLSGTFIFLGKRPLPIIWIRLL